MGFQGFKEGDSVEVSSKEAGFLGSYFEAEVVGKLSSRNEYVLQYKTLLEEDKSAPLREVVPAEELWPAPPPPQCFVTRRFRYGDLVDAFDNDGWWVGTVRGMNEEEGRYCISSISVLELFTMPASSEFIKIGKMEPGSKLTLFPAGFS